MLNLIFFYLKIENSSKLKNFFVAQMTFRFSGFRISNFVLYLRIFKTYKKKERSITTYVMCNNKTNLRQQWDKSLKYFQKRWPLSFLKLCTYMWCYQSFKIVFCFRVARICFYQRQPISFTFLSLWAYFVHILIYVFNKVKVQYLIE